jgi:hypothetical protein
LSAVSAIAQGYSHRAQVHIHDVRSRVAATELLRREGLGRPAQAEEPAVAQLALQRRGSKQMSWTDLQVVCALQFADRVTNATAGEAGRVIRERLTDVGSECRRILREALDDVEASPSTPNCGADRYGERL